MLMKDQRRNGHNVSQLMVHLVWVTKYRYPVLTGEIQARCREILIQICDSEDVQILKGVVSKDRVQPIGRAYKPLKLKSLNFFK